MTTAASDSQPATELSTADLDRLSGVLDELHERLVEMVDWLAQFEGTSPTSETIQAGLSQLRKRFVPADHASYTLADFSTLWGMTNNPFLRVLEQAGGDLSNEQLQLAESGFVRELARIPALILERLETALVDTERANRVLGSLRRFHGLWIDCAEQAFAEVAHSESYCAAQAAVFNQMIAQRVAA